jgi:moderate conductance mechanosensitive channel
MKLNEVFTLAFWQKSWHDALRAIAESGVKILLILLFYWVARRIVYRVIDMTLERLMARQGPIVEGSERANRLRTLQGLVRSVTGYVLFFILISMILGQMSINVTGLITAAGVGGLAIGFGAQKLVKDVINGFFIIMEDQFAVGDYVTIGGASTGVVEEIGTRITRLRDDAGRLWIISNGDINIVTNHSRAPVEAFIEVGVAPGADVKRAEVVINEAGEELARQDGHKLLSPPKMLGVANFDASKTTLRVAVVSEPRALSAEQLRVREAILERLNREGIPVA